MPVLTNSKHETIAQSLFAGKGIHESAIAAGYSPKSPAIATRLVKQSQIVERVKELQEQAANAAVMSVRERKAKLSDIARSCWQNKDGVTPVPNISAINVLNKMDNIYKADFQVHDNRSLTINVLDKRTRNHLAGLIEGEYKTLPEGNDKGAPVSEGIESNPQEDTDVDNQPQETSDSDSNTEQLS